MLPVEVLPIVINPSYERCADALRHLESQGVIFLGWSNSGIRIPDHLKVQTVYTNRSGSTTLYCDPIYRIAYAVDMG